jgi:hypothetical protein
MVSPVQVIEVREIEADGAIRLYVDQVVQDLLFVFRLAVRRQAHDFVLTGIHFETGVVSEG